MGFFSHFVIVFVVALCSSPQLAVSTNTDDKVPIIFAFGDSNTDTGNFNTALGLTGGYPSGRLFPDQPSDRACDGKVIMDYLFDNITTNYLHAYLNAFEPDFSNGANFAWSGATASKDPTNDLGVQLAQFTRFQNRSLDLVSKGSKQKLVGEEGFKRALYLVDMGQNDMTTSSLIRASYDDMILRVPKATLAIKQHLKGLYQRGGRKFWVHNTGPLGCLPGIFGLKYDNITGVDQYGCIKFLNAAAQVLNTHIFALCEELRMELKDATIVHTDIYSIKYDLIANAGTYGFENPLKSCIQVDKNKIVTVCDGPNTINWDGWHYTHAANGFVASRILTTDYSTPSLPFSFFLDSSTM